MTLIESFRKHGAILSVSEDDARILLVRGLADFEDLGDKKDLIGLHVPGNKVDIYIGGDNPILTLVGGWSISRGDRDYISGKVEIDLTGIINL
jgi:hypothetical protein